MPAAAIKSWQSHLRQIYPLQSSCARGNEKPLSKAREGIWLPSPKHRSHCELLLQVAEAVLPAVLCVECFDNHRRAQDIGWPTEQRKYFTGNAFTVKSVAVTVAGTGDTRFVVHKNMV